MACLVGEKKMNEWWDLMARARGGRLILQLWPKFLNFHKNSPKVLEVVLFVWTSEFLNFQKNSLQTGAVVLFVWTFFMSEKERKFRQIVYALFISDYLYELQIFSSWNHQSKWKWPLNRAKSNDDISRSLSWTTLTKDDPNISIVIILNPLACTKVHISYIKMILEWSQL